MAMRTCKSCRWWKVALPDDRAVRQPYGTCRYGEGVTISPDDPSPTILAVTYGLVTHPNFGCVQFEWPDPPLADHYYVPEPREPDPRLMGVSIVYTCYRCGDRDFDHPRRPKQEHRYVEGGNLVPDWEFWGTLGCVTCERPRWEHTAPPSPDLAGESRP